MDHSEAGKKGYQKTKDKLDENARMRSQRAFQRYEANPKHCPHCGTKISYERRFAKFCNSSCAASYNNQGVAHNRRKERVCVCGAVVLARNKYCPDCAAKRVYQRPESVESAKTDEARKKLLLEIRGHRCQGCGLSEWRGNLIPIELHHVNGDTDTNREDNLELLCPNCHAQTDTHRRRNKFGQRQFMRRKRYANGQTW